MKPIAHASIARLTTALVITFGSAPFALGQAPHADAVPAHAPAADNAVGTAQLPPTTGKVVETLDSGGYTYVQVDDGSKKIWAAGPQTKLAVGDKVTLSDGMPMPNFASKTLGRTFDMIYFVSAIHIVDGKAADAGNPAAAMVAAHSGLANNAAPAPAQVDLSNIKKAAGGHTIAELFSDKAALTGKEVVVRGRVVKYTPAVMGKNWVHIRDGSGAAGTNDLTISTDGNAAVGNLVLVRGKLQIDRDLGAGYHYDVIIEDAALTVE
ncbi:MAG: DNA-binding protein [Deltaproteobacteria bacterium]|nr:DNA-binding protein [Deltaproteobacteria bacterium]